ncbi:hypothetical protein C0J52_03131, partial [Blattella germanica]
GAVIEQDPPAVLGVHPWATDGGRVLHHPGLHQRRHPPQHGLHHDAPLRAHRDGHSRLYDHLLTPGIPASHRQQVPDGVEGTQYCQLGAVHCRCFGFHHFPFSITLYQFGEGSLLLHLVGTNQRPHRYVDHDVQVKTEVRDALEDIQLWKENVQVQTEVKAFIHTIETNPPVVTVGDVIRVERGQFTSVRHK